MTTFVWFLKIGFVAFIVMLLIWYLADAICRVIQHWYVSRSTARRVEQIPIHPSDIPKVDHDIEKFTKH